MYLFTPRGRMAGYEPALYPFRLSPFLARDHPRDRYTRIVRLGSSARAFRITAKFPDPGQGVAAGPVRRPDEHGRRGDRLRPEFSLPGYLVKNSQNTKLPP